LSTCEAGICFESLSAAHPHLLVWPPLVSVQEVMKLIRTCLGHPAGFDTVRAVVVAGVLVVAGGVVPVRLVAVVGVAGVLVVRVTTLPLPPHAARPRAPATAQPITRILNLPPVPA
jgi:hypothetical protein